MSLKIKGCSYFRIVRCCNHDTDGRSCGSRPESCQQAHAEHDMVELLCLAAEPSSAILKGESSRLRMQR